MYLLAIDKLWITGPEADAMATRTKGIALAILSADCAPILLADSEAGVRYFGDGVIVSTSSGSTAYNVSAGGPIISPDVDAFCITPICPHSLSFRPVVVSPKATVVIAAVRVNPGTTLFCDGQESTKLTAGDRVIVRRSPHDVLLIEDPDARQWRSLAEKLNWAAGPKYGN